MVLSALTRVRFSFIQFDMCKNEYTDGFVMIPNNNNNYYYTHTLKVYFIHFFSVVQHRDVC